ncbi:ABC transporter ATP-binding protein [Carnimonas bestiolae]|uniref:ABC transporter ATP-binding protein n=1 Tax=Carnimonas bestiolae TaxID=3402172 RepID=UPI003EDBDBE8
MPTSSDSRSHDALLAIKDLNIRLGDRALVEHLDLKIQAGETHALVGESGSGKSLTALSIVGLLNPLFSVSGQRRLNGVELAALDRKQLNRCRGNDVGFIFQEPMSSLNPVHTIGQQLGEALHLHQKAPASVRRARVIELLKEVNLPDPERMMRAYPHALSGGQRQRVVIAMAIANRPQLIIADEPTTALDVTVAHEILELLERLKESLGSALLLITHDLNLVRRFAQHASVMRRGRLVESGDAREVLGNPQHYYTRALLAAEPSGAPQPLRSDAPVLLHTESLTVHYPGRRRLLRRRADGVHALREVSLQLREGETLGIVGESGSGKSTLAKAILGVQHASGAVTLLGQRVDGFSMRQWRPLRAEVQFVFQDPYGSLSPRMSVFEIIAEGLRFHQRHLNNAEVAQRVNQVLQDVGLDIDAVDRYPHEFSGGQRARISLARALILKPRVVLLDEPTAALDRVVQTQLIELLRRLQREQGLSYLFISHDLAVVRALSHRVMVLQEGAVVEQGQVDAVFDAPQTAFTRRLVAASSVGGDNKESSTHSLGRCGNAGK